MSAINYLKLVREERLRAARRGLAGDAPAHPAATTTAASTQDPEQPEQGKNSNTDQQHPVHLSVAPFEPPRIDLPSILTPLPPHALDSLGIPGWDGLYFLPEAIDPATESRLLDGILSCSSCPWEQLRGRKLQQWGALPGDPSPRLLHPYPPWLDQLSSELVQSSIFSPQQPPNNTLINWYESGEGILHHTDGPLYLSTVAILSLASDCVMTFRPKLSSAEVGILPATDVFSVALPARSLFVFCSPWYDKFLHGIVSEQDGIPLEGGDLPCVNASMARLAPGDQVRRLWGVGDV